jgi:hypothetical protein
MKKLFFTIIAIAVVMTTACNKDEVRIIEDVENDEVARMTMTTAKEGVVRFFLYGTGTAVINWGDGTPKEWIVFVDGVRSFSHTYTISTVRTITITGDSITRLCCGHNPGNSADIFDNQLISLGVSSNPALEYLECNGSQLTTLDVSKNTALRTLFCTHNQLSKFDVSKSPALELLWCHNNQLTTLDVSKNPVLKYLLCNNNQLAEFDVSKNTELIWLDVTSNLLEAERLDALFLTLHSNTVTDGTKTIHMLFNPGAATCNQSIAEEKGWGVNKIPASV